jgi:hypothetical protein
MTPIDRLVTVRQYAAPDEAFGDQRRLIAHGITAYIGAEYHRHGASADLRVSAGQAEQAARLLPDAGPPAAPLSEAAGRCARCGSPITTRSRSASVLLQAGVVAVVGLAAARVVNAAGTVAFMALSLVAMSRVRTQKVTCPRCQALKDA